MTYPCPYCRTPATPDTGCPGCGRAPDPDAAEVARLDAEIAELGRRLAEVRGTERALDARLREAWHRRQIVAARVRSTVAAATAPAPPPAPAASPPRAKEASTRLVQNTLFLLGGLLLGVAAIVFTAVAWSQFGVGGRAVLLAGFTAAALAVPPLALRRGLTATAETFAAVGLLLVLLDGYAAWHVDLFGVAAYSAYGYAGAVCAVTAAVAAGYEHVTGLTGPRFAALVVAQPVLPLVVAPLEPDATGWSYTLAALALLDLAVIRLHRRRWSGVAVTAYAFAALAVAGAGLSGLAALASASSALPAASAGAALVAAALVVVAGAVLTRVEAVQAVAGGVLVAALGLAAVRFADVTGGDRTPTVIAAVVALLALPAAAARRMLPPTVARGPRVGAFALLVVPAVLALTGVAGGAVRTIEAARPALRAGLAAPVDRLTGQLPVVVLLLAAGSAVLVPAAWRAVALVAAALVAVVLPASLGLPWWSAPILDLAVAAVALVVVARSTGAGVVYRCAVAVALAGHAVATGFGRPGVAAATLSALAVLCLSTAIITRPGPRRADVGSGALAVALLTLPAVAWTASAASSAPGVWQSRAALGAAALVAAARYPLARRWPGYRGSAALAVVLAAVTAPLWALASGDSAAVYAAAALVLVATIGTAASGASVAAAVPLAAALAVTAGNSVLSVLVAPYGWLGRIWAGRPDGAGLDPAALATVEVADTAAVALAAVGVLLWGGVRYAVAPAALAVPMAVAGAGVPWPGVPAASLVIGLAGLLTAALRSVPAGVLTAALRSVPAGVLTAAPRSGPARRPGTALGGGAGALIVVSAALGLAGLAGALPTRPGTLAALGAVVVAGATAGVAARALAARLIGLPVAVAAALGVAFTAGRTAGLAVPATSLVVLATAAAALVVGTVLAGRRAVEGRAVPAGPGTLEGRVLPAGRRAVEGRAVQAAAHAGAVVALLLSAGSIRHAAAVCTLWGVALGVRALRPGERTAVRHALVVAAATAELGGWWLLIAAGQVSALEAYTLPAAAVALLAGRLALRSRPDLTSWVAYGPALAAALLPTCASVLAGEGQPVRRLLLGAGALAVVLTGAYARLRAPVLVGGGVLAAVALHEMILVWDLLPRWIPLAGAGLLLVALAMTLERRRRDLARVRAALTRMS